MVPPRVHCPHRKTTVTLKPPSHWLPGLCLPICLQDGSVPSLGLICNQIANCTTWLIPLSLLPWRKPMLSWHLSCQWWFIYLTMSSTHTHCHSLCPVLHSLQMPLWMTLKPAITHCLPCLGVIIEWVPSRHSSSAWRPLPQIEVSEVRKMATSGSSCSFGAMPSVRRQMGKWQG
jgi:hypothetical protein